MKEHIFNIHDVVLLMTVAESILLAIFQAVLPAKNRASGFLLAAFLVSVALSSACVLIVWNSDVHIFDLFDEELLPYFLSIAVLVKGPALYFYVLSITQRSFQLKPLNSFHLTSIVPCLVVLFIFNIASRDLRYWVPHSYIIVNSLWLYLKIIPLIYVITAETSFTGK